MLRSFFRGSNVFFFCIFIIATSANAQLLKGKQVLVFTKNGKGYVHENIPSSIAAIQNLGKELGFSVDTTTNAAIFAEAKYMLRIGIKFWKTFPYFL